MANQSAQQANPPISMALPYGQCWILKTVPAMISAKLRPYMMMELLDGLGESRSFQNSPIPAMNTQIKKQGAATSWKTVA